MSHLPPLYSEHNLTQNMYHPRQPFFIGPRDYFVIDGDTIMALGRLTRSHQLLHGDRRPEAFRIRHRAIAAAEKPQYTMGERQLMKVGIDAHENHPGMIATKTLRRMCRNRVLFIEPSGRTDKYGRMLADIAVSGAPGSSFELDGAIGTEYEMLRRHAAEPFSSEERLPPPVPRILERLLEKGRIDMFMAGQSPGP